MDHALGLSDYMADHEATLSAGHSRPGMGGSQAHNIDDSQPPPLQDEDMLTLGPPAAEGG